MRDYRFEDYAPDEPDDDDLAAALDEWRGHLADTRARLDHAIATGQDWTVVDRLTRTYARMAEDIANSKRWAAFNSMTLAQLKAWRQGMYSPRWRQVAPRRALVEVG